MVNMDNSNSTSEESEKCYRFLVENSPDCIGITDLHGNIITANRPAVEIFGYSTVEEAVGINVAEFVLPGEREKLQKNLIETLEKGGTRNIEYALRKKDGSSFVAEISASVIKDEMGKPQTVVVSINDISEREQAEEALRASELKYRQLYENLIEAYVKVDLKGGIVEYNEAFRIMVGYGPDELHTLNHRDLTPEKWHSFEDEIINKQVFQRGYSETYEEEYQKKDGTIIPVELRAILIRDDSGQPVGIWVIVHDISERKRFEDALLRNEKRYRTLLENSLCGIMVFKDKRIVYINRMFSQTLGYTFDDLKALTPKEINRLVHPEDREMMWQIFQARLHGVLSPERYVIRMIHKNGRILWMYANTALVDYEGGPALQTTVFDITERKLTELALKESEERLNLALDAANEGLFDWSSSTDQLYISPQYFTTLGYKPDELPVAFDTYMAVIHPDDRQLLLGTINKYEKGEIDRHELELRLETKTGDWHWILSRGRVVEFNDQGRPQRIVGTHIDITVRKWLQETLLENEKTNQVILGATDAIVLMMDREGIIIAINEAAAKYFRRSIEDLIGICVFDLMSPGLAKIRKAYVNEVFRSGKRKNTEEIRDGFWFDTSYYPILDGNGIVNRVVVFARDVTERKKIEMALRDSEERYRTLAEAAHDMIFIIDNHDQIEYVNSFAASYFRLQPNEMIGQPRSRFFQPDISRIQKGDIRQVIKTGNPLRADNETKFPAGTIWLSTWLVPLKDSSGKVTAVMGVSRDITARKQTEQDLLNARNQLEIRIAERTAELASSQAQLRKLAQQVVTAQEEERRRVSRELHDEAGQALIALKYSLDSISNELPDKFTSLHRRLDDSMGIIDRTMDQIRSLAHSLRPSVIDVGGINISLKGFCRELSEQTRLSIHYHGEDIPDLPDEIGISLYRFVQEATTNVLKHAQATGVNVTLSYRRGMIKLAVADNGKGFDPLARSDGVGLAGIEERFMLLGGSLKIHSRRGQGTKITACIQWPNDKDLMSV